MKYQKTYFYKILVKIHNYIKDLHYNNKYFGKYFAT